MRTTKERLLALIQRMKEAVEEDDSFEGSLLYTADPNNKGMFEVGASFRVGNSMGQGGMVIVEHTPGFLGFDGPSEQVATEAPVKGSFGLWLTANDVWFKGADDKAILFDNELVAKHSRDYLMEHAHEKLVLEVRPYPKTPAPFCRPGEFDERY